MCSDRSRVSFWWATGVLVTGQQCNCRPDDPSVSIIKSLSNLYIFHPVSREVRIPLTDPSLQIIWSNHLATGNLASSNTSTS
jgi:hypothetical protein